MLINLGDGCQGPLWNMHNPLNLKLSVNIVSSVTEFSSSLYKKIKLPFALLRRAAGFGSFFRVHRGDDLRAEGDNSDELRSETTYIAVGATYLAD